MGAVIGGGAGGVRPGREGPRENWARPWAGWAAALMVLAGGLCIWLEGPSLPSGSIGDAARERAAAPVPRVLTPFDFARMGNDAALDFLRALDGGRTLHVVETAGAAVVRFRVSARSTEHMATVSDQGSGVLVNGGRHVLVAGHVLDIEMEHTDVKYEVFTIDGRLRRGKVPAVRGGVDGAPEGDWGLVELEGEQPVDGPWLRLKPAAAGTTVVLLGYSGGNGVDAAGRVYPSFGLLEAPLRPVAVVGKVKDATLGECEVVAGREVLGGASGGAVIDLRGNLVGIAVTQSWEWRMGEVHQRMNSSWRPILKEGETIPLHDLHVDLGFTFIPVGAFREFLERRWGR